MISGKEAVGLMFITAAVALGCSLLMSSVTVVAITAGGFAALGIGLLIGSVGS